MINYIKNNFPIIVLFLMVVGGFAYPFYSGKWLVANRLSDIDSKCYGVDVPESITYNKAILFCSCVHANGHVSKEENYKYCERKFEDKEDKNFLRR